MKYYWIYADSREDDNSTHEESLKKVVFSLTNDGYSVEKAKLMAEDIVNEYQAVIQKEIKEDIIGPYGIVTTTLRGRVMEKLNERNQQIRRTNEKLKIR